MFVLFSSLISGSYEVSASLEINISEAKVIS